MLVVLQEVKPVQEWDDRVPRITWRGDGQYFAISTVGTDKGIVIFYYSLTHSNRMEIHTLINWTSPFLF